MLRGLRRLWIRLSIKIVTGPGWWKIPAQGFAYVVVPGLLEQNVGVGPLLTEQLPDYFDWSVPYLLLLLLFFWVVVLQSLYAMMKREPHRHQLNKEDLQILHRLIREVVRQKGQRFGRFIQLNNAKFIESPIEPIPGNGLKEITRPEDQFFLHAKAIEETFVLVARRRAGRDVPVRCRVAAFEKDVPTKWIAWGDSQPNTPITMLAHLSALKVCHDRRSIVVIEDVLRELQKPNPVFQRTAAGSNEAGSVVCYPISHGYTDSVPYVISIASPEPGVFIEDDIPLYNWILEDFQERLVLEHSLLLIREVTV